jgi:hypothetical protein
MPAAPAGIPAAAQARPHRPAYPAAGPPAAPRPRPGRTAGIPRRGPPAAP